MRRLCSGACHLFSLLLVVIATASPVLAATVPGGFSEALLAGGLANPTAMQIAPDGRIFVCEQAGRLRIIKDGALLSAPFVTIAVDSGGERGLLGVAFDPNFSINRYVYVYYTTPEPNVFNRISRFTANGDVAVAGSEVVLLQSNVRSNGNHLGGALNFGHDGKLYAAVGDNGVSTNAQLLSNLHGKLLRINPDGSIPTDNPFYGSASGSNRAIWAFGLRNPYTFAFNPAGSEMFINDVGQGSWEEINDGISGANYGWPDTEGPTSDPRFKSPRYAYPHPDGCAITGGTFYSPATLQFPPDYVNDYFFADYCEGWIRKLDPAAGNAVVTFATGIALPVDLKVDESGSLYYLARGSGSNTGTVYRINFGASAPTITSHPSSYTVAPGASVTFSVRASGAPPVSYQWQRNGTDIVGALSPDYTVGSVSMSDNGARFRARVTNNYGGVLSNEALLSVSGNQAPIGTITQPQPGTLYSGNQTITVAGTGTDPEDGDLPASAFTWEIVFHHDSHIHPFLGPGSGARGGSFVIPTTGETSANVWYRIHLTVRDSSGLTHSSYRDISPRTMQLTLASTPSGRQLRLDGQPITTPHAVMAVVGMTRSIEAVTPQTSNGTTYTFASWSDGGAASHNITTPATNTTYIATFTGTGAASNGLNATYFDNIDFSGTSFTRIDPTVDFVWSGQPAPGIGADTFSVRWTGEVQAQFTEMYTFYTQSNEGVRLWINGQLIIDNWTSHATAINSGTIALSAGQRYSIRIDFWDGSGSATMRIGWSSPSTPGAAIQTSRFSP